MFYDLEKRMKENYEKRQSNKLLRRIPVILRLDGRAFHTFTKKIAPFNDKIHSSIISAASNLVYEIGGNCKAYFAQSDEISFLLTDYDDIKTEAWFDYKINKINSIAASIFSVNFNEAYYRENTKDHKKLVYFDCRCFNIPREEISNYFLWRSLDCSRNSILMFAQQYFSHKEMQNKSTKKLLEMLEDKQIYWNNIEDWKKNGTFWIKEIGPLTNIHSNYNSIVKLFEKFI